MKDGSRALGIAESYRDETSTLAGCVVRADRIVDGFVFGTCTVGGTDATDAVVGLLERLDRPDVQVIMIAGIAPAWYNVVDIVAVADRTGLPTLSVSFEESDGLESAINEAFDGADARERLECYRAQPERIPISVGEQTLFVRSAGFVEDGDTCVEERVCQTVRTFTQNGRPEPLRVARLAARAADDWVDGR